ncbi:hypothetical protein GCK32_004429, partial [Trichostrongylus colubriformis]
CTFISIVISSCASRVDLSMDMEPPATEDEWARCFGEIRSPIYFQKSKFRDKQISDTVDEVATQKICVVEDSGSQSKGFHGRLWQPPQMPVVTNIAKDIMEKFCAKVGAMSAEAREKMEKPILESLVQKPRSSISRHGQSESHAMDQAHLAKSNGKENIAHRNPLLSQLSCLLSSKPRQDAANSVRAKVVCDTSSQTTISQTNSSFHGNQAVPSLFSSSPSLRSTKSSDSEQSVWDVTHRAEDVENCSGTIFVVNVVKNLSPLHIKVESDEELGVTPPPSEISRSFDQRNKPEKQVKSKITVSTKRRLQPAAATALSLQSAAKILKCRSFKATKLNSIRGSKITAGKKSNKKTLHRSSNGRSARVVAPKSVKKAKPPKPRLRPMLPRQTKKISY